MHCAADLQGEVILFNYRSINWLCVKAVTEPDSAESTEITDPVRTEPTEYNGKIRFPIPVFSSVTGSFKCY